MRRDRDVRTVRLQIQLLHNTKVLVWYREIQRERFRYIALVAEQRLQSAAKLLRTPCARAAARMRWTVHAGAPRGGMRTGCDASRSLSVGGLPSKRL